MNFLVTELSCQAPPGAIISCRKLQPAPFELKLSLPVVFQDNGGQFFVIASKMMSPWHLNDPGSAHLLITHAATPSVSMDIVKN